jgi:hypothetical protein
MRMPLFRQQLIKLTLGDSFFGNRQTSVSPLVFEAKSTHCENPSSRDFHSLDGVGADISTKAAAWRPKRPKRLKL